MSMFDTPKGRSYGVRRQIAAQLGLSPMSDFFVRMDTQVICTMDDGRRLWLHSTTNAGFRGIEGWFYASWNEPPGQTISLGHVESFEVVR